MTPGNQAAITAQEWLSGMNKGEYCVKIKYEESFVANDFASTLEPMLMSLKPGLPVANPYQESDFDKRIAGSLSSLKSSTCHAKDQALKANLIEEVNISNNKIAIMIIIKQSFRDLELKICLNATSLNLDLDLLQAFVQEQLSYQDAKYPQQLSDLAAWHPDETQMVLPQMPHCCEPSESPPPINKGEVREGTTFSHKPKARSKTRS